MATNVSATPVPELVIEPALQSEQAGTFDAAEYLPAAHSLHVMAPVEVPVFVMEPDAHKIHAATFDAVEYFPASHGVHVVAPALIPVFV